MTAREYLRGIGGLQTRLEIAKEAARSSHIEGQGVRGIDYSKMRVQTSHSNHLEDAAWRMVERYKSDMQRVDAISKELNERIRHIEQMPNKRYSAILFRSFVKHESNEEIGRAMFYGKGYVCDLKRKAVNAFEKQYREELDGMKSR